MVQAADVGAKMAQAVIVVLHHLQARRNHIEMVQAADVGAKIYNINT